MFADSFLRKWSLPPRANDITEYHRDLNDYFVPVRMHVLLSFLKSLDVDSTAGLDGIADTILKKLAAVLLYHYFIYCENYCNWYMA